MRRTALSDGDASVEESAWIDFVPPGCTFCGEGLRPHVVFFGEQVKKPVVESAFTLCDEAELLLVAGTSLTVFSGYRFVKRARERGIPYVMVNLDETRADEGAAVIVRGKLGEVLPALARALTSEDQMPTSSSVSGWSVSPSS
jgi:NAD-dependent deacetylase sirtuin 4